MMPTTTHLHYANVAFISVTLVILWGRPPVGIANKNWVSGGADLPVGVVLPVSNFNWIKHLIAKLLRPSAPAASCTAESPISRTATRRTVRVES